MSTNNLNNSYHIITAIGKVVLPNGKKFEDHFSFNGVSYWKVFESYNILYSIPNFDNLNKFQLFLDFIKPSFSYYKAFIIALFLRKWYRIFSRKVYA